MGWTIKRKLSVTVAGITLLVLLCSVICYQKMSAIADYERRMAARNAATKAVFVTAVELFKANSILRGYFLPGIDKTEIARLRDSRVQTWTIINNSFKKLKQTAQGLKFEGEEALLHSAEADLTAYQQVYDKLWEDFDPETDTGNEKRGSVSRLSAASANKIRDDLDQLVRKIDEVAAAEDQEAASAAATSLKVVFSITALVMVIGTGINIWINRQLGHRVARVLAHMQTIASGDLRSPAQGTVWSDEFGEIVSAIDKMRCGLRELIVAVTASVERLAGASEEISAATTEAAKGSETQRSETGQASTAVHQMSSAVLQVTDHSQHAAEAARKTSAKAHEGGEIITKTIADMRSIAGTVTGSGNKVKELGVRSEQIGKIVNVIDEIADQTNLLALNAAIEAARAGDQGRGFAVVADEVRKLAERTTKATKEISEMVQAIQTETNDAVSAMKLGTQQAENGVQATAGATAALQEIIQMADQLEGMITQIATAATQQSSAAEEVNGTLKRITTVVGESAGAAQHTAQACQDLANLAVDLQNIVGRFRVDTEAQEAQEARRRTSRHRPEGDGRPRAERPDGSAVLAAHDGRPAVH